MAKKLLIIDDDFDILESMTFILEEEGYKVLAMMTGEDVFNVANKFKPDAILLDVLISGIDGREISKKLKSNTKTSHIPIIIISAHPEAKKTSFSSGADYFIEKPFEVRTLKKIIAKALLPKRS